MSMYISVSGFNMKDKKLDANYTELCREIVVTDFLNDLLTEKYISIFSAFEEDDVLEYKEVSKECVASLSEEIDKLSDDLFIKLNNTSGKSKKEEIVSKLRDITLLNQLIKVFLFNGGLAASSHVKIIIS
ncbi:hypothetical protein [Aeromonas sp. FDAARGOS 1407]|uniref:hypothetical protein n=1 Tax=Aeromonas TaxID=642 RepID=UPI001C242125|nr:hypothetical protein [Aeromonas sp. FDAARGOS 1407]QXC35585.1 hypothetical protein I6L37_08080 [Aeromonas sp. FDAARGOS 1407]